MRTKKPMAGFSLAWKLILAFAAVVLVGVVVVSILANRTAATEVRGFIFQGGMTSSALLRDELAAYYRGRGSWQGVDKFLGGRGTGQPGAAQGEGHMMGGPGHGLNPIDVTVTDATGQIVAGPPESIGGLLTAADQGGATAIAV